MLYAIPVGLINDNVCSYQKVFDFPLIKHWKSLV